MACEFVNGVPVHSLELDAGQEKELVLASVDYRITSRGSGMATEKVVSRAPSLTEEKSFSVFITLDSAEAGEDTFSGCLCSRVLPFVAVFLLAVSSDNACFSCSRFCSAAMIAIERPLASEST